MEQTQRYDYSIDGEPSVYHKRVITQERVPCGLSVQLEWFDAANNLLRRDQQIVVLEGLSATGSVATHASPYREF